MKIAHGAHVNRNAMTIDLPLGAMGGITSAGQRPEGEGIQFVAHRIAP
jgi:hypothetical protein